MSSRNMMISGQKNSFQAPIKLKIARVARIGRHSGSMIEKKMRNSLQPSIRAASRISSGMSRMNWRSMKIPKTLAIPGTISPVKVLSSPRLFKIKNTGIMVTWPGTIMV
ncbi:MAG: hypothetical protein ACD_39C00375G0001, partial [uncultured bacterium]